ncbi:hypothetical protein ACHAWF_013230 [Thalassiosira exigua]
MSCSKKRKQISLWGFSTAAECIVENRDASDTTGNVDASTKVANEESFVARKVPSALDGGPSSDISSGTRCTEAPRRTTTINLTVRGIQYHEEKVQPVDSIMLRREPGNRYGEYVSLTVCASYFSYSLIYLPDSNAISVHNANGSIVGHMAKEQAAILAPEIDAGSIRLGKASMKEGTSTTLLIATEVNLINSDDLPRILGIQTDPNEYRKYDLITDEAVQQYASGIADQDAETASTCPFDITQMNRLPWKKTADGITAPWPPSQTTLDSFGYGGVEDADWWRANTGLKPPAEWDVTGALDLLPSVPVSSHQKTRASDVLDNAVQGVTNVWCEDTLVEIQELMHSDRFWCHRGADAFIRAFGGNYVLGQTEGKLKLIKGSPHTTATERICRGHNAVYELLHSAKPPAPGFNTLIFGLNLRRSGFHYHQDTIASLKAKNAPLVARQPVVTTVYYEKPELDEGKELVLWKPLLNFKPRDDSMYMAARGIQALHGMVHVQRSGLQSHAQHGIFHRPIFENGKPASEPRQGYRVAITARITHPDSDELIKAYVENDHYSFVLGPDGNKTLCR